MRAVRAPRTPGMAQARTLLAVHEQAARSGRPAEEILGELSERRAAARRQAAESRAGARGHTRREVLAGGVALAAGAALGAHPAGALARRLARRGTPRIAIVGAGLAGLRCAHMMWTESPGAPLAGNRVRGQPGSCRWPLLDAA